MNTEECVAKMNETLVDQEGIVTFSFDGREETAPKSVGNFVKAEMFGCNVLLTFSQERILLFTPLAIISIVGEQNEDGGFPCKDICSQLFIGEKPLGQVLQDIDPS